MMRRIELRLFRITPPPSYLLHNTTVRYASSKMAERLRLAKPGSSSSGGTRMRPQEQTKPVGLLAQTVKPSTAYATEGSNPLLAVFHEPSKKPSGAASRGSRLGRSLRRTLRARVKDDREQRQSKAQQQKEKNAQYMHFYQNWVVNVQQNLGPAKPFLARVGFKTSDVPAEYPAIDPQWTGYTPPTPVPRVEPQRIDSFPTFYSAQHAVAPPPPPQREAPKPKLLTPGQQSALSASSSVHITTTSRQRIVVMIIDLDSIWFHLNYIAAGRQGGQDLYDILLKRVCTHLKIADASGLDLRIRAFHNHWGLARHMENHYRIPRARLGEFSWGLQSRWHSNLVHDTGPDPQSADLKAIMTLEDYLSNEKTYRVFFGGLNDRGYEHVLQHIEQRQYLHEKLTLLLLPGGTAKWKLAKKYDSVQWADCFQDGDSPESATRRNLMVMEDALIRGKDGDAATTIDEQVSSPQGRQGSKSLEARQRRDRKARERQKRSLRKRKEAATSSSSSSKRSSSNKIDDLFEV